MDGELTADGNDGRTQSVYGSGGGSGGSVYLTAAALSGAGVISADGGDGGDGYWDQGGGGGGGRIAVYYEDMSQFTGTVQAQGGWGYEYGGAGTIWLAGPDAAPFVTESERDIRSNGSTANTGGSRGHRLHESDRPEHAGERGSYLGTKRRRIRDECHTH